MDGWEIYARFWYHANEYSGMSWESMMRVLLRPSWSAKCISLETYCIYVPTPDDVIYEEM